jgi:phosphatidylglycerol---prolipoprotein diacylglyceryl transferase
LYSGQLSGIFRIWDGGLSIIGGVIAGVLGVVLGLKYFTQCRSLNLKSVLDLSIFGLPAGQFIGRLGNYVNQELYGLPTEGVFKIYIDRTHRFPEYINYAYYHPLFFYEMIVTGAFALGLYLIYQKNKKSLKVGSGNLFLIYVAYYSFWRIILDFLRIDRGTVRYGLGFNQIFLILVVMIVVAILLRNKKIEGKKYA